MGPLCRQDINTLLDADEVLFFHMPRHHNATSGNGASTWTGSGTAAKSCRHSCHHKTGRGSHWGRYCCCKSGDKTGARWWGHGCVTYIAQGDYPCGRLYTAPRARRGRPATRPAGAGGTAEPEVAVPGLMSQLRDIVNDAVREALQRVPPPAGDTAPATAVAPDSAPAGVSLLRGADGAAPTMGIRQP